MKKIFEKPEIGIHSLVSEEVMLELGGIGLEWCVTESNGYNMIED